MSTLRTQVASVNQAPSKVTQPKFEVVRLLLNGWEVCSSGTILPNGSLRYFMPDGDTGTVREGRWRKA
jgi:hypothetical protein